MAMGSACGPVPAAVINITTNDSSTRIEAEKRGDTVVIAPGTYAFRVYLTNQVTQTNSTVSQALDPSNPPVWDFGATLVENAPGSYTAGDRGRGGWQFSGAQNYAISSIVFRHCRTASFNSAGIRYYNGTTNLYIKDCVFDHNDNGLTGGTQNSQATVEFCDFNANGNTNASLSSPAHNIYVYGGYLALRYCYFQAGGSLLSAPVLLRFQEGRRDLHRRTKKRQGTAAVQDASRARGRASGAQLLGAGRPSGPS